MDIAHPAATCLHREGKQEDFVVSGLPLVHAERFPKGLVGCHERRAGKMQYMCCCNYAAARLSESLTGFAVMGGE